MYQDFIDYFDLNEEETATLKAARDAYSAYECLDTWYKADRDRLVDLRAELASLDKPKPGHSSARKKVSATATRLSGEVADLSATVLERLIEKERAYREWKDLDAKVRAILARYNAKRGVMEI